MDNKALSAVEKFDVIVVGGGNAAMCAALSAREDGASVLVLERSPEAERGGNSSFTDGVIRFAYDSVDEIVAISEPLTSEELATSDFGLYPADRFFDDMAKVTEHRTDPDLCETVVRQSQSAVRWLKKNGVKFMPNYGRQSYRIDGRIKFAGGAPMVINGGGPGLIDALYKAARREGIVVRYGAWVQDLVWEDGAVRGVVAYVDGRPSAIAAGAVVLACGGFEANAEWRARYLGKGWDLAKVRGSKYNTGDGLAMALKIGAQPAGHWSGCHAVSWELYATDFGDPAITPNFQRHSYPFGIIVNAKGKRFVDEGADIRNYTYAKYGHIVLEQPGQFAWQVFDGQVLPLLRDEYRTRQVTKVTADSLEALAEKLEGVDPKQFLQTVREFNAAVDTGTRFDPSVKDGRATHGLEVPKSNWANRIDTPPFEAYAVTCGITFTYGGLRIDTEAQVRNTNHDPIPGLFAAGEIVGGIYYFNAPGGSGLASGAVFGRIAGQGAARAAAAA
ncbi:FAD-dependent tricarballylate dehydrogenase TcuA [Pigmentiphaga soli]|uniref:FAD-dependent tricarballylate dehydrogenase TcuA n=2 Tax=Pigmentiphaga soli TaxID=1007095 RepID=A0ABP8HRV6_9BURK